LPRGAASDNIKTIDIAAICVCVNIESSYAAERFGANKLKSKRPSCLVLLAAISRRYKGEGRLAFFGELNPGLIVDA
jgi:hypothetical protein